MDSRAAIADGNGNFKIDTIRISDPGPSEVLVKIMAAGVCHTDYDTMRWPNIPLVMGHEGAGIVEAVEGNSESFAKGDKVLLNWADPCGTCAQCKRGAQNICISRKEAAKEKVHYQGKQANRSFRIATMSEYTLVHEKALTKIEIDIPFTSACIIGCGVMTGFGSAVNAAKVNPGSSAAVIGTGGVGLNIIQGARIAGAKMIIALDLNEERLKMAQKFGATHIIKTDKDDKDFSEAAAQVKEMTNGEGADFAFESTAIPALGSAPLALCRNGGTAVQASGIEESIAFDMNLFEWDKTYINPLYGQCVPERDFPLLLNYYKSGDLLLDEMVTRTYKLDDLAQAFEDMHAGINAKGVLDFTK
jgi:S-(hydroxymethyl)glutathione dehydrogenase / alcohol dehydrogenase